MADDDANTLAARVLAVEHSIYPEAVRLIQGGRLRCQDQRAWLDDRPLDGALRYDPESGTDLSQAGHS